MWKFEVPLGIALTVCVPGVSLAGAICAHIVDPGNLPLPHAVLNVSNLSTTAQHYAGEADHDGNVCIDHIAEGLYAVEVSMSGFLNVRYYPVKMIFPHTTQLEFRLPFGNVNGDTFSPESILSGTLKRKGEPVEGVNICLYQNHANMPSVCDKTDDIGEYALTVPTGTYELEMSDRGKVLAPRRPIDLSVAGLYRDRLSLDAP